MARAADDRYDPVVSERGDGEISDADRRLIMMLARDGRRSFASMAEELGVAESTVRARLSHLLTDDVVTIVALCNALLLGHTVVRLLLKIHGLTPAAVARNLCAVSMINHVALVSGAHDIYLEATCRDQEQLIDLLDDIRRHPGIASIQPIIVTALAKDYTWNGLRGTAGQSVNDPDG